METSSPMPKQKAQKVPKTWDQLWGPETLRKSCPDCQHEVPCIPAGVRLRDHPNRGCSHTPLGTSMRPGVAQRQQGGGPPRVEHGLTWGLWSSSPGLGPRQRELWPELCFHLGVLC